MEAPGRPSIWNRPTLRSRLECQSERKFRTRRLWTNPIQYECPIRRRRGADAWQELVSRQAQSGLSVPAFCRREGISAWSLYSWRSRVGAVVASEEAAKWLPPDRKPSAGFIDLGALGPSHSRFEVRLDLGGGVQLHLLVHPPRPELTGGQRRRSIQPARREKRGSRAEARCESVSRKY
jgi:putative transposase